MRTPPPLTSERFVRPSGTVGGCRRAMPRSYVISSLPMKPSAQSSSVRKRAELSVPSRRLRTCTTYAFVAWPSPASWRASSIAGRGGPRPSSAPGSRCSLTSLESLASIPPGPRRPIPSDLRSRTGAMSRHRSRVAWALRPNSITWSPVWRTSFEMRCGRHSAIPAGGRFWMIRRASGRYPPLPASNVEDQLIQMLLPPCVATGVAERSDRRAASGSGHDEAHQERPAERGVAHAVGRSAWNSLTACLGQRT